MRLPRRTFAPRLAITSLVDLILILLFFFMVSSTYLNLRMLPLVRPADASAAPAPLPARSDNFLVRLGADGAPAIAAGRIDHESLRRVVADRVAKSPEGTVLVLPSPAASTQALVSLLDVLAGAGARDVRLVRLEAR